VAGPTTVDANHATTVTISSQPAGTYTAYFWNADTAQAKSSNQVAETSVTYMKAVCP
jgi:hypothetical protein